MKKASTKSRTSGPPRPPGAEAHSAAPGAAPMETPTGAAPRRPAPQQRGGPDRQDDLQEAEHEEREE
eukprot:11158868-Lingulodinium_polyedra.AAC.1